MVITVLGVAAMLIGQFLFSDRYLFFLPMNWALLLIVSFQRSCANAAEVRQTARVYRSPLQLVYKATRLLMP